MTATAFADFDRRSGIGASEVPGISGLSPWATPAAIWLDKVGLNPGRAESNPMVTGTALERTVLRLAGDLTDTPFRHNRMTFRHPDPDVPLYATPDGFSVHRRALAEVKVVGFRGADWSDGPPVYVRAQVQAQLACLPRVGVAIVGALIGSEVRTWRLERDRAAGSAIAIAVRSWWREYVEGGVSPPPMSDDDSWAVLKATLAKGDRPTRIATDDEDVIAAELRVLLAHQADLKDQVEERRLRLALAATDEDIAGASGWRAAWHERRSVDWSGLARAERIPKAIVEQFTTTAPVFTFRRGTSNEEAAG